MLYLQLLLCQAQCISCAPGVQIATIPVSIPLDAGQSLQEGPITYQSHLWMEGHVPGEGEGESQERIVELRDRQGGRDTVRGT